MVKQRFIYNANGDKIRDCLQETDLISSEIVELLNEFYNRYYEYEASSNYYKGMTDIYQENYNELKKKIDGLIRKYDELAICEMTERSHVYTEVSEDLRDIFRE